MGGDEEVRIHRTRHARPLFDPDWLSPLMMLPSCAGAAWFVLRSQSWLAGHEVTPGPIAMVFTFLPLVGVFGLLVLNVTKKYLGHPVAGADSEACTRLAELDDRFACAGDSVEFAQLERFLMEASRSFRARQYVWFGLLWGGAFVVLILAALDVTNLGGFVIPNDVYTVVIVGTLGLAYGLPWFFRVQYELEDGNLSIFKGFSRVEAHDRVDHIQLADKEIECHFPNGELLIRQPSGSTLRIRLDGLARRHEFVGRLFAAARTANGA